MDDVCKMKYNWCNDLSLYMCVQAELLPSNMACNVLIEWILFFLMKLSTTAFKTWKVFMTSTTF